MIDFDYLSKGVNALARAHRINAMAGHLGAAVVAGYFIGEQHPDLDDVVYRGIEGDLDRVMRGESLFGAKRTKKADFTDAELFADFPKEKPDEMLIDGIAEALEKNIGKPRQSGHNVIFASLAIRALKDHPDLATPSVTDGIRRLMAGFDGAHPGSGYYGKGNGRIHGHKITLPEEEGAAAYTDLAGMAAAVMEEIIGQDPLVRRQGYGGLVHINNHAAALADLAQYGYPQLLAKGIASHYRHVRLWRNLPNVVDELGPVTPAKHLPHHAAYWTSGKVRYDSALLTHRVKTMYGFDELVELVEDESKRKRAYEKLRYLM